MSKLPMIAQNPNYIAKELKELEKQGIKILFFRDNEEDKATYNIPILSCFIQEKKMIYINEFQDYNIIFLAIEEAKRYLDSKIKNLKEESKSEDKFTALKAEFQLLKYKQ